MENGNGKNHESNITVIDSKSVKYLLTKLRDRNTLAKVGFIHDLDPKKAQKIVKNILIPKSKLTIADQIGLKPTKNESYFLKTRPKWIKNQ